ncbi:hypothetical protein FZC78_19185 [Rossellomorea vietnamensis]|uniref:Uncharacterized protein n=1 Tax=Rossellomorea vietnamensis TaxID=218284 RepID=A0A5D4NL40_9BACI|nr:hypothetical protein [Rossellomorea vietnamensis]TYS14281.1 hypothetical protein FZC78_19185 [Rossellomorea vietnamensis]
MDLNILITTIVTSTAALVAIIGGFLVSRIISLSSEQNAAEKRLQEIEEEHKTLKSQQQLMNLTGQGDQIIRTELQSLEEQKLKQKSKIESNSKPAGIWSGLVVLFYACLVGICWPSMLLPYPLDTFNDGLTKNVLLILFYSELFVIFLYLVINIRKLTRNL